MPTSPFRRESASSGYAALRCVALVCIACCLAAAGPVRPALAEDAADGWVNLLEKGDFSQHWTTQGNWKTGSEAEVNLEPRPGESGWQRYDAYLTSKEKYQDFEIEFDYKVAKDGNSGFYFHVGNAAEPVSTGIEVQIYDSHPKGPNGQLGDHDSGGIIPGIPPTKNAAKPAGEWNHFQILCQGKRLLVKLNGETVNDVDLTQGALASRPPTGYIAFQDHGLPLGLRAIRIRKL